MIEGYMPKQDVADILLDLRNYASIDISCWRDDNAKVALWDLIGQIDLKLKEIM